MAGSNTFDVIVLGVGGMGSAAVYHLARRGLRVLGIEQFGVPHDRGSSHGVNRIYRLAYYEHPSYVPLMQRAHRLWLELEEAGGEQLVYRTGSIDAGPPDGEVFNGSLESCRIHGLDHEVLDSAELSSRFPGYRLSENAMAVLQPDGGFVLAERAILAHVHLATGLGAEVHTFEVVHGWETTQGSGVRVETDQGSYEAGALVVTAGAWTGHLMPDMAALAVPERQVLGWFEPLQPEHFAPDRFPVFNLEVEEGRYYGFPVFGVPGFKIGLYHHLEQTADPDHLDRLITREDEQALRAAVARYFPDANGPTAAMQACMFTNSPDEHFLIDTLPDHPHVHIAAGFSGHGYKFASAVGEIMAELATTGDSDLDLPMFRLSRFA